MNERLASLETALRKHGYSITSARQQVFLTMLDQAPLTMGQLAKATATELNRSSLYRVVELYEKLGIINRLQLGWNYKLELSDAFAAHHHHMTCTRCGRIDPFEESTTIRFELKQLAQEKGFTETGHQLELRGICSNCRT